MLPYGSSAVTSAGNAEPAKVLPKVKMTRWLAAAGLTVMPVCVPAMAGFVVSVTVSDWDPAVFRVTVKVWTPWSAVVKV